MIIRQAEPYEYKDLEKLYQELCSNENIRVLPQRIQEFLDSERDFLLVCEVDQKIVGTLTLNICLNAELGEQCYAIFENMVVLQEYRKKGVGTELLKFAESIAKEYSCEKIMFLSSVKREDAHKFFKNLGFNDETSRGFKKYLYELGDVYE